MPRTLNARTNAWREGSVAAVSVYRLPELDDAAARLIQDLHSLRDEISQKAYHYYQTRGASDGGDVEDWLRAEQELSWVPHEELHETDRAFHVMVAVSSVPAQTIEVILLPEMVIIRGARENENREHCGADRCDSGPKLFLRRIIFPSQIHTESAVVSLKDDRLWMSAAKVDPACAL